jgi:hypothetical protein
MDGPPGRRPGKLAELASADLTAQKAMEGLFGTAIDQKELPFSNDSSGYRISSALDGPLFLGE